MDIVCMWWDAQFTFFVYSLKQLSFNGLVMSSLHSIYDVCTLNRLHFHRWKIKLQNGNAFEYVLLVACVCKERICGRECD